MTTRSLVGCLVGESLSEQVFGKFPGFIPVEGDLEGL